VSVRAGWEGFAVAHQGQRRQHCCFRYEWVVFEIRQVKIFLVDNLQVVNLLGYEEVRKNGKTYARFVKSDLDMSPGLIHFNFDNLFNGDKALGDSINKVMNENWKEVFEDVKSDYTETVNRILLSLLNGFFSKVSIEEAFD
jgi:hypothetical protein